MNATNNFEMDEMRQQMETLKKKLDAQQIVNDRLMRRSMKSRMSWINRYLVFEIFLIPFVAITMLPLMALLNISWWWYGFTLLMVTADVCADWYINYLPDYAFQKNDLLETSKKLERMKQLRRWSTIVGFCVLFFWAGWLFVKLWNSRNESEMAIAMMTGTGIGGLIGCAIGLYVYFKMQRTNDEIIDQIEDLTEE